MNKKYQTKTEIYILPAGGKDMIVPVAMKLKDSP